MDVWTCTALHAHFQSTFSTRVHKNLCTRTRACMHTIGLLTRVITPTSPDFLLKLMKNPIQSSFIHFGQIWSNLMKKEIVIFILMQQSTNYSTELLISSKSNSFVIMNCCQLWHLNSVVWFEKPLFSAVFLRHTITTAVEVRRTAENCGFLNHNYNALLRH